MDHLSTLFNLSTFLSVFIALNLAYAGIKRFRKVLKKDILSLEAEIKKIRFDERQEYSEQIKKSESFIIKSYYSDKYIKACESILDKRKENIKFTKIYIEMFFASGIFGITQVIIFALYQDLESKILILATYSYLIFFLIIYIFISGFTNKETDKPLLNPLKMTKTIRWIFGIFGTSILIYFIEESFKFDIFRFSKDTCIFLSIFLSLLSYILFFIRAFYCTINNEKAFRECKKILNERLEAKNDIDERLKNLFDKRKPK